MKRPPPFPCCMGNGGFYFMLSDKQITFIKLVFNFLLNLQNQKVSYIVVSIK